MRLLMALCLLAPLGFAWPGLAWWIWSADLAFVMAFVLDFLQTPNPGLLDVRRSLPERVGLDVPFIRLVRIGVAPTARASGLRVELFEEFAAPFEVCRRTVQAAGAAVTDSWVEPAAGDPTGGPDCGHLSAQSSVDLRREYACAQRGVFSVGDMRLRLTGPLGLVQRQRRLFGEQSIRVVPALLGLKNTLKLAVSERWHDLGVRFLRRRGGVTEFESMRDYVKGDDRRSLDWKAFAKRGRPMVRQYQEERGQELILLVDQGRRMGATTAVGSIRGWSKLDHALDSALQLAAVALDRGDRVGIATFDSELRTWIPPARGRAQFGRLRDAIFDALPRDEESLLHRALQALSALHRRRATVLIVSDVADLLSARSQGEALSTASARHKVIFAGLDDPAVRAVASGEREAAASERAVAFHQVAERERGLLELERSGARVIGALPAESAAPMLAAWLETRRVS